MNSIMREEHCTSVKEHHDNTTLEQSGQISHTGNCSESCHAEEILNTLNSYRKEGIFTDVVLLVDGQEFPCHRATLSANSAFFKAMFNSNLKEGKQKRIPLTFISAHIMDILLDYMYVGKNIIQEDNVEKLLEASDLLQISKLREACALFLESQIHACNCLGIMKFADIYSISSLFEKSRRLFLEDFLTVSQYKEFLELSEKQLIEYLSDDQLVVEKEELVFEAVMRWVSYDVSTREKSLKDVLEHVRLPLLHPLYFLEKVELDPLIKISKECHALLLEARQYHLYGNEQTSVRTRPRRFMNCKEVIVTIGGCDKKGHLKLYNTDLYNPDNRRWTTLACMPGYTRSEYATCILKNDIYVSGGHMNSTDVWMLNTKLNFWIKLASLNKGRWRHRMVSLQGRLYAVGGFDGFKRLSNVECYDPFSNQWSPVSPLLEAVSSPAVATCKNKMYVIGGALDDYSNTSKVQCYDPVENSWIVKNPSPFCQRCINAVSVNNMIYVVGGLMDHIYQYMPDADIWRNVNTLSGPLESCGVTVCDGKIYILGGRDSNGEGTDKVYSFDPTTEMLVEESSMRRCVSNHGCVTILQNVKR
ncbi:kelch-like protein 35 [Protopterus annectens]|uniref:kelch-like protein 35 n=1 Tax=Protopterus annectens TaxID=7888 RepID=UPI001CFB28FE|nr:kelch-like protein 35 [Protopterus annectens]